MNKPLRFKSRSAFALTLFSAILVSSCTKTLNEPQAEPPQEEKAALGFAPGSKYVPGELLVKFKKGVSSTGRTVTLSKVGGEVKERILTATMKAAGETEGVTLISTSMEVMDAIARLKGNGDIEYAEPNYIYHHDATSNDPYYTGGSLWGMYGDGTSPANQFGSQAGEAWALNHIGSSTIVVGIIDEGVMHTHEDLSANIWRNPKENGGVSGFDDDGNGYVDDIYGWDFANNNNTTYDGSGDDHGTHVAGTIGGVGGNGKGVAGVAWRVKMITAKFLGSSGGTTANAIKAIDYITDLKKRHSLDLVATNNSWGGGGFSQSLKDAIDRSGAANILFVAAAGNGGSDGVGDDNDATPHYPSSYTSSNIIAVASITSSGAKSGFSNYGATSVDLGAPGSGIWSTVPSSSNTSAYASYNGTSMATPHVTGGAALRAAHSTDRGSTLKSKIMNTTVPTSSLNGRCVTGGRLNVSSF